MDEMTNEAKLSMDKSIEAYKTALNTLRTGRANAAILDGVNVDYYGSKIPLNQISAVSVFEAKQLVVKPYDKNDLKAIVAAINAANIGLVPVNDGQVVRLNIPPLTEERRKEIVKQAKKFTEECKVSVRNIRREYLSLLKDDDQYSEDFIKRIEKEIQDVTDQSIKKIDSIMSEKEKEIMLI